MRKGHVSESPKWADKEIVDRALEAVAAMSQEEAAALLGVSQSTVSNWINGSRPQLKPANRRHLLALIERTRGLMFDLVNPVEQAARQRAASTTPGEPDEEVGALSRIAGLSDPLIRTLERESLAAVIRAQGMRDACRAARIEAEKAPMRVLPDGATVEEAAARLKAHELYMRRQSEPAPSGRTGSPDSPTPPTRDE